MKIECHLQRLPEGEHGFHIHQSGDLSKGCSSLCSHFNPYGTMHGGRSDTKENRHVGDLGNIRVDSEGVCDMVMYDKLISFHNKTNIIGRSIVIHRDRDDLGKGGDEESLKTGNAGKRIAFGIIGRV
jgi:Cu-Zn family superoxide dismutase